MLSRALARLPRGSALIFRHYHLALPERRTRYTALARIARRYGHVLILSGSAQHAQQWKAKGCYGSPKQIAKGPKLLRIATVHSMKELAQAHRNRATAALISPVFKTASHPGARGLGTIRMHLLAQKARIPAIALGGMNAKRVRWHRINRWAAIDGLSR